MSIRHDTALTILLGPVVFAQFHFHSTIGNPSLDICIPLLSSKNKFLKSISHFTMRTRHKEYTHFEVSGSFTLCCFFTPLVSLS